MNLFKLYITGNQCKLLSSATLRQRYSYAQTAI